ncbi:hypothetical protein [Nocardioides renjunii]|uniref:hypothetical protein n=1 Tax=Nocardioides renjunii TaxID=3095075 RepID=UPI002AFE5C03|nr:hypothetical protein [Nocardioides sp. S-34]WQQ23976.1 hypothetical protein SHK17_08290 [Nocardioides sp. S-34]
MDTTTPLAHPDLPAHPAHPAHSTHPPGPSDPRSLGRARTAAAVTSVLVAAIGAAWFAGDTLWYFAADSDRGSTSLLALVPKRVDATLAVLLGAVGLVAALAAGGRWLVGVAVVQVVAFVLLAGDAGVLLLLAYLTALLFPFALVACLLWGAARHRSARIGLGILLAVGGAAVVGSGIFDGESLRSLGDGLGTGVRRHLAPHLVVTLFVGHGLLWAAIGIRAARSVRHACEACGRPGSGRLLLRWRVPVTLLAAACGLPYFLVRLTWLTGDPFGVDGHAVDAQPGLQLMGFLLGLTGLVAAVLTIGLLRPWGRVFPGWIPVVGRREVPVLFPTLAAGLVGVLMTVAGRSMVQSHLHEAATGGESRALYLFLLPLPVWGPALLLAAAAYHLQHRGPCAGCGQGDATLSPRRNSGAAPL